MPFLGSQPADQYQSLAKQTITGDGSTAYTLNRSVTNAYDMEVFINNVRQEPDVSYTASGNTITFTQAVTLSDSCYLIYQGQAIGTINPPANSVGTSQIANTSVTHAKLHTDMDLSSKTVRIDAMNMSSSTNKMQLAIQSAVSNRFALRSTYTADYDNNPFIVYQPSSAGVQNDALVIDEGGRILTTKQPSFMAYGGTWNYQASTYIWQGFATVDHNIGSHWNNSTGRFTAPVAGRYMIYATVHHGSGSTYHLWAFLKNGSLGGGNWVQSYNSASGDNTTSKTQVWNLAAGDYLEVASNASYANAYLGGYVVVGGHLVG
jgi:hypothetical protein